MQIKQKYLFTLTLVGHLLFLFSLGIMFHSSREINLGEIKPIINSYNYQESSFSKEKITPALAIKKQIIVHSQLHRSRILNKEKTISRVMQEGKPKQIAELLALLHAEIQAQQHYPDRAVQMEYTGSVTLAFLLFPNGLIEHLKVVKPSGFNMLDDAAVNAINSALPFKGVEKYLHGPQEYQITISFEL